MSTSRNASGFLLAEALVAIGITSLLVLAICAFTMFSGHSFAALFNYVDLDDANRICMDQLSRDVRQRNPVGGSYDVYPVATPGTAKVVDVSWLCSRTIFGRKENTESVQTARIVIRKQGT